MLSLILEILALVPRVIGLFPNMKGLGDDITATLEAILQSGDDRLQELADLRTLVLTRVEEGRAPTLDELDALRRMDDDRFARITAALAARD
jgi:hypothetical protein